MAETIDRIIDEGVFEELNKLLTELGKCDEAIKTIALDVEAIGKAFSESSGLKQVSEAYQKLSGRVTQLNEKVAEHTKIQNDASTTAKRISDAFAGEADGIDEMTKKIRQNAASFQELTLHTAKIRSRLADTKKEMKALNDSFKAGRISSDMYKRLLLDLDGVQTKYRKALSDSAKAMKALENTNKFATGSMKEKSVLLAQLKDRYKSLSQAQRENKAIGGELLTQINGLDAEIKRLDASIGNYQRNVGNYGDSFKGMVKESFGEGMFTKMSGMSTALGLLIQTMGMLKSKMQEYVNAFLPIDDAMTNVSKYTGLARADVEELNVSFQGIDTRTPIEKLNALAADAGRLGITSKDAIKDFVEAGDIINVALGEDLGEDAVKNIGKMAKLFGDSDRMGLRGAMVATASAINQLGQSSSASEPYIMEVSSRLAGVANAAGMTQSEIMGIASALDQNMQKAEMSSTALQKFIVSVSTQSEDYAKLLGMPIEEFSKLISEDMNSAIVMILEKFKEIKAKGGSELFDTFGKLHLSGVGLKQVLAVLADKVGQVKEAQEVANTAFTEGTSVMTEYAAANGNSAAEIDKMNNQIQISKANIGKQLYPLYQRMVSATLELTNGTITLIKWLKAHKEILIVIGGLFAKQIGALTVLITKKIKNTAVTVTNTVVTEKNAIVTNLSTIRLAANAIKHDLVTKKITLQTAATEMLNIVMKKTPWGLVAAGVAAVVTGIIALVKHQKEANKAMNEFRVESEKEIKHVDKLFDNLKRASEGSELYEKSLKELKETYPDVIAMHLDENGKLKDLKQAYDDVCASIRNKIALQKKSEKQEDITTEYIEESQKHIDAIMSTIKSKPRGMTYVELTGLDETKQEAFRKRLVELVEDEKSMLDIAKQLNSEFGTNIKTDVPKAFGALPLYSYVQSRINSLKDAFAEYKSEMQQTDEAFAPFETDTAKATTEVEKLEQEITELNNAMARAETKTEKEAIRKEINEKKALLEQLKNATSETTNGEDSDEDEVDEKNKKLQKFLEDKKKYFKETEEKLFEMQTHSDDEILQHKIDNLEKQRKEELQKYGQTEAERAKINERYDAEIAKLRGDAYRDNYNKEIEEAKKCAAEIEKIEKSATDMLLALEEDRLKNSNITTEELTASLIQLEQKKYEKILEEQRKAFQKETEGLAEGDELYIATKRKYDLAEEQQEQAHIKRMKDIRKEGWGGLIDKLRQEQVNETNQATIDAGPKGVNSVDESKMRQQHIREEIALYEKYSETLYDAGMTEEQYTAKMLELKAKLAEETRRQHEEEMKAIEEKRQKQMELVSTIGDGLVSIGNALAENVEDEKKRVMIEQSLALGKVLLEQAIAIASATAASTEGDPYTLAIRIAAAVAAITTSIIAAKRAITESQAATANVSSYATGTNYHKGGAALVAEAGSPEVVSIAGKETLLTSPTIIPDLPIGSKVYTMAQYAHRVSDKGVDLGETNELLRKINGKGVVEINVGKNVAAYLAKGTSRTRILGRQFKM